MSKVAFVGVGRMGANMARHLQLDCGHDVTAVFDVNRTASAEIATELGAKDCEALSEVTEAAEIIFTVVTNDDAMRAIFLHDGDNLFSEASGKTFINCATLSPGIHKEVYEAGKEVGAHVLEGGDGIVDFSSPGREIVPHDWGGSGNFRPAQGDP